MSILKSILDTLLALQAMTLSLIPRAISGFVVGVVFFVLATIARRLVRMAVSRSSTQGHVDLIVAQLCYVSLLIVGALAALSAASFNVGALVTSLGLAGVAIGFAVKDILGNFLSGILLLMQRPFTIGDSIAVGGHEGRVENIRVRDTLIKTGDHTLTIIPNSVVFNSVVVNKSAYGEKPIVAEVILAPESDPAAAVELGRAIIADWAGSLETPAPEVNISAVDQAGYVLTAKSWVDAKSSADSLRSQLLIKLTEALTLAGHDLFEQREEDEAGS